MEIEFRGHTIHVLELKMLVELKRTSNDPKDKQRLPVLEETLRQSEEKFGSDMGPGRTSNKDDGSDS